MIAYCYLQIYNMFSYDCYMLSNRNAYSKPETHFPEYIHEAFPSVVRNTYCILSDVSF
jgi:hypothetical protein